MKRRTGSPGGWVPVAATIEYERPDLVRLKLLEQGPCGPLRREVLVGLARRRHDVSEEKGIKVCVEVVSKTSYGLNHLLLIFGLKSHALLPTGSKLRSACLPIL